MVVKVAIQAGKCVRGEGVTLGGGVGSTHRGGASCEELALASDVGGAITSLPSRPSFAEPRERLSFVRGAWEMAGGKNSGGGNGQELVVGHREVCPSQLALMLHI